MQVQAIRRGALCTCDFVELSFWQLAGSNSLVLFWTWLLGLGSCLPTVHEKDATVHK